MFEYKKLSTLFGVEVLNFNANTSLTPTQITALKNLIFQYKVVLLRQQNLSPQQQIHFTQQLGPIEPVWDENSIHPHHDLIHVVSNENKTPRNTRGASEYWHTDGSFRSTPTFLTLLYAKTHPRIGGDTLFADMQLAYETLDDATKVTIENLMAIHSYDFLFKQLQTNAKSFPDIIHHLVEIHPITRKKALYLNELCLRRIDQMPAEQSEKLLNQLYSHALNKSFIYTHQWQENDLLIWDNTSVIHRRAQTPSELRVLYRTSVSYPPKNPIKTHLSI